VVEGTVIAMNKREVVINIGYKSEGVISLNEFRYNPELKVGDTVEVLVENQEDKKGQLVLSHKKARSLKSWDRVNESLEQDEIIKGYIKCSTKGGMIVDVFGIEAFLPGSQIDVKPIRDYDIYVGKTMEFKVVKINQEFKNVVVSHKALIEAELEQQKKEIIAKLEKGQVLEGTVKNITSYGVFIDLGGVDGLIHITDLSWGRVNHPEEIVQPSIKNLKWLFLILMMIRNELLLV
jgi:small subunit ribosomal protein S1